jgi:hypothetical protein
LRPKKFAVGRACGWSDEEAEGDEEVEDVEGDEELKRANLGTLKGKQKVQIEKGGLRDQTWRKTRMKRMKMQRKRKMKKMKKRVAWLVGHLRLARH